MPQTSDAAFGLLEVQKGDGELQLVHAIEHPILFGYVALCPVLDIASQGDTVEAARTKLIEALELFFESADSTEIARRLHTGAFITSVEVAVG